MLVRINGFGLLPADVYLHKHLKKRWGGLIEDFENLA
jgi:hypothetical protein